MRKSCLNSCAPPDHTGKFEVKMTFIGLYDAVVYTYDKPFKYFIIDMLIIQKHI